MKHQVLFLCSGNYYRSRFAEIVFNSLAASRQLDWTAFSRGLTVDGSTENVGPISQHALEALLARGIDLGNKIRFPLQIQSRDFEQADLVVALNESEHRALLNQLFPRWAGSIVYWQVPDLHAASAAIGLSLIEREVQALVERLVEEQSSKR